MNRILHISVSVLLLAAYVVSFSLTPAAHSHPAHEKSTTRHVHLQSADPTSDKGHSSGCIYCIRIQSSAVVLTNVLQTGVPLPLRQTVSTPSRPWRSSGQFAHCPGRAPPIPLA